MQQVLKLRIIGSGIPLDGTRPVANLSNNLNLLFRKDGIPTKMFADVLRTLLEDIQNNSGMLTLRFDWDV